MSDEAGDYYTTNAYFNGIRLKTFGEVLEHEWRTHNGCVTPRNKLRLLHSRKVREARHKGRPAIAFVFMCGLVATVIVPKLPPATRIRGS